MKKKQNAREAWMEVWVETKDKFYAKYLRHEGSPHKVSAGIALDKFIHIAGTVANQLTMVNNATTLIKHFLDGEKFVLHSASAPKAKYYLHCLEIFETCREKLAFRGIKIPENKNLAEREKIRGFKNDPAQIMAAIQKNLDWDSLRHPPQEWIAQVLASGDGKLPGENSLRK